VISRPAAFVEESGERHWLAELHRIDGRIELKRPVPKLDAGGSMLHPSN